MPFRLALLLALAPLPAIAGERGSDGLEPLVFSVRNQGPAPIACVAAVAHWFALDLGAAAAGEALRIALWRDPRNGTVYALNAEGDRLPIERLWCGIAGRSWATRAELPFADPAAAGSIACGVVAGRLHCR